MEFRPHKYQDYAREFIIGHPVCALILDMGLGCHDPTGNKHQRCQRSY